MGYYIDWPDRLGIGKAARLKNDHGAVDFEGDRWEDVPEGKILVAVAENREGDPSMAIVGEDGAEVTLRQGHNFDAAGVVYDEVEFRRMRDPSDTRTVRWLLLDRDEVERLVPRIGEVLP